MGVSGGRGGCGGCGSGVEQGRGRGQGRPNRIDEGERPGMSFEGYIARGRRGQSNHGLGGASVVDW